MPHAHPIFCQSDYLIQDVDITWNLIGSVLFVPHPAVVETHCGVVIWMYSDFRISNVIRDGDLSK